MLLMQIEPVENHVALIGPRSLLNLGTPASCLVFTFRILPMQGLSLHGDGPDAYALYICGFCGAPEATLFGEEIAPCHLLV